jgi:hypothetical protein
VGEGRWGLTGLTAALVVATVLAGGCTALPAGGAPASAPARPALGEGNGGCCGLIVRGPQPDWDPDQIVSGFLLASAKPANNFALAREYLAPGTARTGWRPGSGVTILAGPPQVSKWSGRLTQPGGVTVEVTGQEMATLKGSQYTPSGSGDQPAQQQSFGLVLVKGHPLIGDLPNNGNGLLLTDTLFHLVYTARDLFYDGLRTSGSGLVPNPVFVPAGSNPAQSLVDDLLNNPPGELRNTINTSFQPGMSFGRVEVAPGRTAIVNLYVPAGTSPKAYPAMAKQLVATLTSAGYGPRLFDAVELKVNGTLWSPSRGGPVLTPAYARLDVPHPVGNGAVYYVDPTGTVRALSHLAPSGRPVLAGPASGRVPLGDVAVSPDGRYLAGLGESGDAVYTAGLNPASQPGQRPAGGQLRLRLEGTGFTSLSWDNQDDLWVAGQACGAPGVCVLYHGRGTPMPVSLPRSLDHQVTGIRVAPDGIRVAMLVGRGTKAHMVSGYILQKGSSIFSVKHVLPLGPSLFDVTAMTWFDGDHLVAAAKLSPSGAQQGSAEPQAQLWEVPANGDMVTTLHWPQAGVTSITAAGPESSLYLTAGGRLLKSVQLGEPWTLVTAGQAADYPG